MRPALIVLDPLASCMVGLEESSTGDMQIAVDALNTIRRATGAAINVVHHTGWSTEHERGSSVLRNACRVVIKLTTDDSGMMTLTCEKANNGRPFEARYFRLVEAGPSVTLIPASKATTRNAALTVKLIAILNPIIRGWANYHRHIVSKRTYSDIDRATFLALWRWATRRHPSKSAGWRKTRYFQL